MAKVADLEFIRRQWERSPSTATPVMIRVSASDGSGRSGKGRCAGVSGTYRAMGTVARCAAGCGRSLLGKLKRFTRSGSKQGKTAWSLWMLGAMPAGLGCSNKKGLEDRHVKIQKNMVTVDIDALIKKAVGEGYKAGEKSARLDRNFYQMTEARLYAVPALIRGVCLDQEELDRLKNGEDVPSRSHDIVRFASGGSRISSEDKALAVMRELEIKIAKNEHEIAAVRAALKTLEGEYYYETIPAKYFDKISDDVMAKRLHCEDRTIRRQRSRLVKELSVLFYGVDAV